VTHTDESASTVALLRTGILSLGALALLATGAELAMEEHWKPGSQLVPWASLVLSAIAIVLTTRLARSSRQIRIAQALAVVVIVSAGYGVIEHVKSNYESAPLDFRYSETWETMAEPTRMWLAVTHQVGPSPTLAPLALAYGSMCVVLATFRHPALVR
jgi:hypothetical protein